MALTQECTSIFLNQWLMESKAKIYERVFMKLIQGREKYVIEILNYSNLNIFHWR